MTSMNVPDLTSRHSVRPGRFRLAAVGLLLDEG
jgi:hypothetical protein